MHRACALGPFLLAMGILAGTAGASPPTPSPGFRAPPAVLDRGVIGGGGGPMTGSAVRHDGTLGQSSPVGTSTSATSRLCSGYWGFLCRCCDATGIDVVPSFANRLFPNAPNPFGTGTRILYSLASAGRVEISIHDLRGSRVITLVDAEQLPGVHEATWDARDAAGRPVASGVYFCRIRADRFEAARKMLVVH